MSNNRKWWRLWRNRQCKRHRRCRFNPWVGKIPWRRKWQPTPVFLPRKFCGQRSLVGYSPCVAELDMTEWAWHRMVYGDRWTCPSPGDLPHSRIESMCLMFPALAGRFFTTFPRYSWSMPNSKVSYSFLFSLIHSFQGSLIILYSY